jgi:hypothetical protein
MAELTSAFSNTVFYMTGNKGEDKSTLCLIKHHTIKAYGGGGVQE